jgi:uncharacterized membrane protein
MQTESPISKFKREARAQILNALPNAVLVSVVWFVISMTISLLGSELTGMRAIAAELNAALNSGGAFYSYNIFEAIQRHGSVTGSLLSLALSVCSAVIGTGFTWYALRVSRGEKPDYRSLFDGFTRFGRVLLLCLIKGVIVYAGLLFLVIPGVILWLRYSMAIRICYDNPDFSAVKCLRESARLMRGLKVEYLTLGFSFFGWFLLGLAVQLVLPAVVAVPVTDIWLNLYAGVAASRFYDAAVEVSSR